MREKNQALNADAQELLSSLQEIDGPSDIQRARLSQRLAATLSLPMTTAADAGAASSTPESSASTSAASTAATSSATGSAAGKLALLAIGKWLAVLAIGAGVGIAVQSARTNNPQPIPSASDQSKAELVAQKETDSGTTTEAIQAETTPTSADTLAEQPEDAPSDGLQERSPEQPSLVRRASKPRQKRDGLSLGEKGDTTPAALRAEERKYLREARWLLKDGQPAEARAKLRVYAQLFPQGELREEASALRIHALIIAGDTNIARRSLQQFRRAYPNSIYLISLEQLVDQTPTP